MIWLALLPFSFFAQLVAVLLAPALPLFAKDGWLPRRLSWFGTPDNDLYGDAGHLARWKGKSEYWQQVAWLVRNRAYSFHWDGPLGACVRNAKVKVWGDPWIRNRDNARAGWYFCKAGGYWNFKCIVPLFADLAFMLELGWKMQEFAQRRIGAGIVQYVFSPRLTAFYPGEK